MRKLPITFKAHPDLKSMLEASAASEHRTVSEVVQAILIQHYELSTTPGTYAYMKATGHASKDVK